MSRNAGEDQVARRIEFSEAHPEVTIAFDREAREWKASWPDGGNGTREITRIELRDLLDRLEAILG